MILNTECIFAPNLSSPGCSQVGSLFTNEEQKRVGSWQNIHFCHTCWPCSWCHRHRTPDTKWQRTELCLRNFNTWTLLFFSTIKTVNQLKNCWERHFYSIPKDRAQDAPLLQVPFKQNVVSKVFAFKEFSTVCFWCHFPHLHKCLPQKSSTVCFWCHFLCLHFKLHNTNSVAKWSTTITVSGCKHALIPLSLPAFQTTQHKLCGKMVYNDNCLGL